MAVTPTGQQTFPLAPGLKQISTEKQDLFSQVVKFGLGKAQEVETAEVEKLQKANNSLFLNPHVKGSPFYSALALLLYQGYTTEKSWETADTQMKIENCIAIFITAVVIINFVVIFFKGPQRQQVVVDRTDRVAQAALIRQSLEFFVNAEKIARKLLDQGKIPPDARTTAFATFKQYMLSLPTGVVPPQFIDECANIAKTFTLPSDQDNAPYLKFLFDSAFLPLIKFHVKGLTKRLNDLGYEVPKPAPSAASSSQQTPLILRNEENPHTLVKIGDDDSEEEERQTPPSSLVFSETTEDHQ